MNNPTRELPFRAVLGAVFQAICLWVEMNFGHIRGFGAHKPRAIMDKFEIRVILPFVALAIQAGCLTKENSAYLERQRDKALHIDGNDPSKELTLKFGYEVPLDIQQKLVSWLESILEV